MIEPNKLWNTPWLDLDVEQKLEALRDTIKEIADEINSRDDTPARHLVSEEEFEELKSKLYSHINSKIESEVGKLKICSQ
ncbi:hypothetical protein LCGC14_0372530 [marine sediment metagenome]|uniref:Uncharacterized protein n=1 Tax=marine sediment metagenome TaxID=412755 RepID=A0A0F9TMR4_9ZZZZ